MIFFLSSWSIPDLCIVGNSSPSNCFARIETFIKNIIGRLDLVWLYAQVKPVNTQFNKSNNTLCCMLCFCVQFAIAYIIVRQIIIIGTNMFRHFNHLVWYITNEVFGIEAIFINNVWEFVWGLINLNIMKTCAWKILKK